MDLQTYLQLETLAFHIKYCQFQAIPELIWLTSTLRSCTNSFLHITINFFKLVFVDPRPSRECFFMFTCSRLSHQDESRLYVVFIDKQDSSMDKTEPFVTATATVKPYLYYINNTARQTRPSSDDTI